MRKTRKIGSRFLRQKKLTAAIAVALTLPAGGIGLVQAQETELEEITITGSRIVRRDFEANSPISTVDAEAFDEVGTIGIESVLNQLPQFIPAATQFTDNGTTTATGSTITAGASTISLRGLAPNRNLVLLDGRRAMPVNATMAVDINSIPSAAIQRVEVITGGASSVYGADAVAGVVNFILKKDFEGADFDVQYGAREDGTGGESRFSGLFGANFADGKGNVMIGLEYANRRPVDRIDTDFYLNAIKDPDTVGTQLFHSDSYYRVAGGNAPDGAVVDSIFSDAPACTVAQSQSTCTVPRNARFHFNTDNTLYTGAATFGNAAPRGLGSTSGLYRYTGSFDSDGIEYLGDTPWRKINPRGEVEENIIGHQASIPLNRYSFFGSANYEFANGIEAFAQANMVESKTSQLWQWSPAANGWGAMIPHGDETYLPSLTDPTDPNSATVANYLAGNSHGLNCGPIGGCTKSEAFPTPTELNSLLDSRTSPEAPWLLSHILNYAPPRQLDTTTRTFQLSFGLNGEAPSIDGTWDIVASHGTSATQINQLGFAGLTRYRGVVTSANYGKGFFAQGNAEQNGFSGGIASCTSGLPVFFDNSQVTEDCLKAFELSLQNNAEMTQDYVEANIQGKLIDLPAGEARFSLGTQWRRNKYFYVFDTLTTQNSYIDLSLGTFPADNTAGETSVTEVYGELFLPVLDNLPGIEHLNLELGYRYSDYELQGGIATWKVLADWAITEDLRFRGGYQLASRAPNVAEMFQAKSQTWGFGQGDMCGLNTVQANGANAANGAQGVHARAICEGLMGGAGAADFYDPATVQPGASFGLWFANAIGNPEVQEEEATTITAGLVWQPSSSSNALLSGFSATLDWYEIEIDDMIAVEADSTVYNECLSMVTNPTGSLTHPACLRITRNPGTGGSTAVDVTYANTGHSLISGIDFAADWNGEIGELPGTFGVNFQISTILDYETQASEDSAVRDWKGSLGPGPETSLNGGAYDYRTFTTITYGLNNWNFNLRWRHLPEADSAQSRVTTAQVPDVGAEESYDIFDFSTSWSLNDNYSLRFGIDNLFDTDAVITGKKIDIGTGNRTTSGADDTLPGFYDVLGRRLYVGFKASF